MSYQLSTDKIKQLSSPRNKIYLTEIGQQQGYKGQSFKKIKQVMVEQFKLI